jgi:mRNA interferase RelE/StbE
MKTVIFSREATKDLRRHRNMATRITKAIDEYAAGRLAHANNVTEMVGIGGKRLRVGSFRVIFAETASTIVVTKIGPRGGVYD